MSVEFNRWAASYFSWGEEGKDYTKHDIESCELAWDACKRRVLEILKKPQQNLDLSVDEIDQRYIDEINKL